MLIFSRSRRCVFAFCLLLSLSFMSGNSLSSVALESGKVLAHTILPAVAASSLSLTTSTPLVILHGLFGSSRNFLSWAKLVQDKLLIPSPVVMLDMRNHGKSYHNQEMAFPCMASDVVATLSHLNIQQCHLIGHSMGGKVAGATAIPLNLPTSAIKLKSLTMMDISPVKYSENEFFFLKASLERLSEIKASWRDFAGKNEIFQQLIIPKFSANDDKDLSLSKFILSNVIRTEGSWSWAFNLEFIQQNYENLLDFPTVSDDTTISTPTLVLRGSKSNFVKDKHLPIIKKLFPNSKVVTIENAGHWLHIHQPQSTSDQVADFLNEENR